MDTSTCNYTFDQTDPNLTSSSSVIWDGDDIPCLGICSKSKLTPLVSVIANKICEVLSEIDVTGLVICQKFIDDLGSKDKTISNLFQILFDYNCTLPSLLDAIDSKIDTVTKLSLNLSCLTGSAPPATTINSILQLIIDSFCILNQDYTNFKSSIIGTINSIVDQKITDYKNSISSNPYDMLFKGATLIFNGNILNNFDATGKGIPGTTFEKWAICNGANGTKDRRGFLSIMATQNLGLNSLSPIVSGNPVYYTSVGSKGGSYGKTLTTQNIPSHTHMISTLVNDPGHSHSYYKPNMEASAGGSSSSSLRSTSYVTTSKEYTGITVSATASNTGGSGEFDIRNPYIADIYIEKIF